MLFLYVYYKPFLPHDNNIQQVVIGVKISNKLDAHILKPFPHLFLGHHRREGVQITNECLNQLKVVLTLAFSIIVFE